VVTTSQAADALRQVAEEAASCTRCELYRRATQTVFGEGPVPAGLMLVGEQPGDREDRAGRPFVGPAGRILDAALAAAELDRQEVYITNAVKHFRWTERGKRRIHQRPNAEQVDACAHWLEHEIALVQPRVVVAMGATAVQSLFVGRSTISRLRGRVQQCRFGVPAVVTVHPASIVRLRDSDERERAVEALAGDLRMAAETAAGAGEP